MFKVKVPEHILEYSRQQTQRYNFGNRSHANGTPDQQLTGIIGEATIQGLLGLPLVDGSGGGDGGVDIVYSGLTIDVKTMGRSVDVRREFVNNFLKLQERARTDILLFCSLNKRSGELTVCGWCPKREFLEKARLYPVGSTRTRADGTTFQTFADLYEIKNDDLYDVSSIEDLEQQLKNCIVTLP